MDRRNFFRMAGAGIASGSLAESVVAARVLASPARQSVKAGTNSRKALMKAGTQHGDSNEILRVLAGFGVKHLCSRLPAERLDEHSSVEGSLGLRDRGEVYGRTSRTFT